MKPYLQYTSTALLGIPYLFLAIFKINYYLTGQKDNYQFWGLFLVTLLPLSFTALILQLVIKHKKEKLALKITYLNKLSIAVAILNSVIGVFGWLLFLVTF